MILEIVIVNIALATGLVATLFSLLYIFFGEQ